MFCSTRFGKATAVLWQRTICMFTRGLATRPRSARRRHVSLARYCRSPCRLFRSRTKNRNQRSQVALMAVRFSASGQVAIFRALVAPRFLKPVMFVGRVIDNEIDDDSDAPLGGSV